MSIAVPPLAYNQTLFRSCYSKVHTRFHASSYSATTVNADQHNANAVANITRSRRGTKSGELKTFSATRAAKGQLINTRNPLDENKLEGHLRSVAAAGSQITLQDVEGYRPQTQPSITLLEYESQYNLLVQRLVRSFSLEQLTQVLELYHLQPPPKPTKRKCARSIVEQEWNWPSLADVRRKKTDTEFSSKTFPLSRHVSFLLLGKDGSQLLQLSLKHNVHVSFSDRPLSLKAEGLSGSLRSLEQDVKGFIAGITQETFALPVKRAVSLALIQHVSRTSGAFLETVDSQKLRIFYSKTHPHTLVLAKELIMQGLCQETFSPTLAYSTPRSPATKLGSAYSLYPFFPAQALLWAAKGKSYFRVRRVGRWLDAHPYEDMHEPVGIESVTLATGNELTQIKSCLLAMLGKCTSLTSPVIRASPGHFVLGISSPQRTTLTPPLQGSMEITKIVHWINNSPNRMDLVPCLSDAPRRSRPQEGCTTCSLLYVAVGKGGKFSHETLRPPTRKVLQFEFVVSPRGDLTSQGENADSSREGTHGAVALDNTTKGKTLTNRSSCQVGYEGTLDLLRPDRNTDIRFSATNLTSIDPNDWPQQLKNYHQQVDTFLSSDRAGAEPEPPMSVAHSGVVYALNSRIQRQTIPSQDDPLGFSEEVVWSGSLDEDNHPESAIHQVVCNNLADDANWASFIQRCDSFNTRVASQERGREHRRIF